MPSSIDTRNAGLARASKRSVTTVSGITSVAATGVLTLPAGFLDQLEHGDVVSLSGLTGGSAYAAGQDYYIVCAPTLPLGHTTCQLAAELNGPAIVGGTAITAGSISTGKLTAAADGVLAGSHGPSQRSARGR